MGGDESTFCISCEKAGLMMLRRLADEEEEGSSTRCRSGEERRGPADGLATGDNSCVGSASKLRKLPLEDDWGDSSEEDEEPLL